MATIAQNNATIQRNNEQMRQQPSRATYSST
jgi:hypothetical protein